MSIYSEDASPNVTQCDGDYKVLGNGGLQWAFEGIAPSTGTMEFHCPNADPDAFFPVSVEFISSKGLCQVSVSDHKNYYFCPFSVSKSYNQERGFPLESELNGCFCLGGWDF